MSQAGYEKQDVNLKIVSLVVSSFVILMVVALIILDSVFVVTKESAYHELVLQPESAQKRASQAQEQSLLDSYAVVDKKNQVFRIPVKRAMQILAEENFRKSIRR